MTIVFDFDYTLYNTDRIKKATYSAAERAGVSSDVFESTLPAAYGKSYKKMKGGGAYVPQKHCELIGSYANCDPKFLYQFFLQAVKQSHFYLYDDVISTMEIFKEKGYHLIILTFGNAAYQRLKIEASGIERYIDDVLYVEETHAKHSALPIENDEKFIFVNDNASENEKVQEVYPHARCPYFSDGAAQRFLRCKRRSGNHSLPSRSC